MVQLVLVQILLTLYQMKIQLLMILNLPSLLNGGHLNQQASLSFNLLMVIVMHWKWLYTVNQCLQLFLALLLALGMLIMLQLM